MSYRQPLLMSCLAFAQVARELKHLDIYSARALPQEGFGNRDWTFIAPLVTCLSYRICGTQFRKICRSLVYQTQT